MGSDHEWTCFFLFLPFLFFYFLFIFTISAAAELFSCRLVVKIDHN